MASNSTKQAATEEVEIQMTPMIDVTFLLLIFFLCSIKFKLLDGKMQTYLPRDLGVNTTPVEVELEKIEVQMEIAKGTPLGFRMAVNGQEMPNLNALYRRLDQLHRQAPELKCTIYPGRKIEYGHVVKVVNECLRANMTQITFGGTPMDE